MPTIRHRSLHSVIVPLLIIVALTCGWGLGAAPLVAASASAPVGQGGAVVTEHSDATAAGLEILAAGGNAVDAAVASALALAVVYPEAGNLGGGGFAVVKMGAEVRTLDFREIAPAAASATMYLGDDGQPIPEASLVGPLAAGVPGSPAGLEALHQHYGALPWAVVVEPARRLAVDGFRIDAHLAALLGSQRDKLERFPETAEVWLPDGEPLAEGTHLRLPRLGETLGLYARGGAAALADSDVARRMEAVSTRHGGILTTADLAAYEPRWREPVRHRAFGWEIAGMGLPSSGGAIVGQVTRVLEHSGWHQQPRFGAERIHWLAESLRFAFADRYLLGDPATTELSPSEMLADDTVARRSQTIDGARATPSARLHPQAEVSTESADTTHLSTVDRDGNLVALTTTLNGLFGSGVWVPGLGFLNNEMDDFATAPGRPNLYGLIQGRANAVAPGKRMLSSMSPTIAWRTAADNSSTYRAVALGGRGGSRIPTHVVAVLLHLIVDGDPLQDSLDRPRLHHQWLPDRLEVEADALAPETRAVLETRGHDIAVTDRAAKVQAVALRVDGRQEAAADPRSSGVAGVLPALPAAAHAPEAVER